MHYFHCQAGQKKPRRFLDMGRHSARYGTHKKELVRHIKAERSLRCSDHKMEKFRIPRRGRKAKSMRA